MSAVVSSLMPVPAPDLREKVRSYWRQRRLFFAAAAAAAALTILLALLLPPTYRPGRRS